MAARLHRRTMPLPFGNGEIRFAYVLVIDKYDEGVARLIKQIDELNGVRAYLDPVVKKGVLIVSDILTINRTVRRLNASTELAVRKSSLPIGPELVRGFKLWRQGEGEYALHVPEDYDLSTGMQSLSMRLGTPVRVDTRLRLLIFRKRRDGLRVLATVKDALEGRNYHI